MDVIHLERLCQDKTRTTSDSLAVPRAKDPDQRASTIHISTRTAILQLK